MKTHNLFSEISAEVFGRELLNILKTYGFGVLGKSDLEAALLYSILQASDVLKKADSFERAEILRITDQRYRTISLRVGMWLGDDETVGSDDQALFSEFLALAIRHPLASRCQVSTTNHGDLGRHQFKSPTRSQRSDHARFFKSWLRRIAPDTHLDQACGTTTFATALASLPPQKNIGTAMRPRCLSHFCGYRYSGTNP